MRVPAPPPTPTRFTAGRLQRALRPERRNERGKSHSKPAGRASEPAPTATEGVYRATRTRTFTGGSFTSATSWGNVTLIAAPTSGTTTDTDYVYRLATSLPSAPSGGTTSETHTPSGWSRSEPEADEYAGCLPRFEDADLSERQLHLCDGLGERFSDRTADRHHACGGDALRLRSESCVGRQSGDDCSLGRTPRPTLSSADLVRQLGIGNRAWAHCHLRFWLHSAAPWQYGKGWPALHFNEVSDAPGNHLRIAFGDLSIQFSSNTAAVELSYLAGADEL